MTCLFDLFERVFWILLRRCLVQFHFLKTIISVNDEKGNLKLFLRKILT